jgi:predicted RND superfamily exporter protein
LIFIAKFQKGSLIEKADSIAAWAKLFEKIIVDSTKGISGTLHLRTIKTPVKGGFIGLKTEYVIPKKKKVSEDKIRKRIAENSDFTKSLVSKDESILGMVLYVNPDLNRPKIVEQVFDIVERIDNYSSVKTYLTGATVTSFLLSKSMKKDFSILLPLCLLVASILLYVIFRKVLYVVASLIIIAIAIVYTFGIMGLIGIPFSVVTSVIPIILFPVGVANSIHVLKTYSRHRWQSQKDFIESFSKTYNELIRPIVLTSVTTFIGFGSFVFSEISWTRHFGVFTGIGVMISLFLTVLLLPIFIYYEPVSVKIAAPVVKDTELSGSFMTRFRKTIFESNFYVIFLIVLLIIFGIGVFFVRFESNPISMFSPKSTIRKSDALIAKYFGGTRFFYILLTHKQKKLTEPALWEEIDSIVNYVQQDDNIGDVSSLMPLINKTSQLLSDKNISKAAVSLLMKSKGLFGKSFKKLVNSQVTPDRKTVKLSVTCKNIPGFKYTVLAKTVKGHIEKNYPDWDVQVAGSALLIDSMITLLIKTMISSVLIAFLSVFFVLMLLFKSFKIGVYTTLPMILSTAFVYALMGLFRVPINTVTVIIVNTCIGIGIDYAIHFTAGYMYIKSNYADHIDALLYTVKNKGSVIMFNTYVVGAGFFVLIFSSFPPIRDFGLFIFLSMFISSTFALVSLPVFFKKYR